MAIPPLQYTAEGEYIFSVQELNLSAKNFLEKQFGSIWVRGELSNLSKPASGHYYFTLKDQAGQIRCAFFKQNQFKQVRQIGQKNSAPPEEGQHVLVKARVTIYPERGDYQLLIEEILDIGVGLLQQQFQALKEKLSKAGLFDTAHKKPIPKFIYRLGIITSQTGAALQDVRQVLARRFPLMHLIIYHSSVQGENAPAELIAAIKKAHSENRVDAILLTRGGGSLEDLWAFNNEVLVQEIYQSKIPIISAVGHEIDFTLCDFVSDLRAPTPSAAAEMISPNQEDLFVFLDQTHRYLNQAISRHIYRHDERLNYFRKRLKHPRELLTQKQIKLHYLTSLIHKNIHNIKLKKIRAHMEIEKKFFAISPGEKISRIKEKFSRQESQIKSKIQQIILQKKQSLALLLTQLEILSPLKTLARGYSIATDLKTQKIITRAESIKPGDLMTLRLFEGELECRIEKIKSLRYNRAGKI
jgi:exodeoxyribonuclease VII large subunit